MSAFSDANDRINAAIAAAHANDLAKAVADQAVEYKKQLDDQAAKIAQDASSKIGDANSKLNLFGNELTRLASQKAELQSKLDSAPKPMDKKKVILIALALAAGYYISKKRGWI